MRLISNRWKFCIVLMQSSFMSCLSYVQSTVYPTAGCASQMDVTLILDRSDYLEPNQSSWVVSIGKQLMYGLPVESGRARVAVITYGDNATVNFYLNTHSTMDDMLNEMSFGHMGSRSHLQVCRSTHSESHAVVSLRRT